MKARLMAMLLLTFGVLFLAGCGGSGSSSTTATGTVSGTVTLPANTNAKLFGKNATVSDYTTLTVSAGGASTKPDAQGKYSMSVSAGTNIEVTVTAPSGSVVLTAIVPSVTTGVTASQDVNTTTTAVALIYKQNTSLTISQISSSSAVTNVKNAIEAALIDSDLTSITATTNSSVTSAVQTAATPALSSITLSPSSATVVSGATQTFTATGVDQFGGAFSFTPTFSVSSSSLGTVSSSGVFTASKTGTGTLTVTGGTNISASATLTVTTGALNSLVLSPTSVTLYKGNTQQFTVYGVDANGNAKEKKFIAVSSPTWSVTGTMGSVDANGLFTASAQGMGKVQAQTTKSDGTAVSITSDVTVSNRSPSVSSVSASSSSIAASATTTITATASDADSDTLSYSWSATGGTISGTGSSVTYTAPSTAGTYTVSVTVSDGNSGSASGSVSITITAASSDIASSCSVTDQFTFTDVGIAVEVSTAGLPSTVDIADSTAVVLSDGTVRMYFEYLYKDGSSRGHKSAVSSDGITFTGESGDRITYDANTWGPHIKAKFLSDGRLRIYNGATPSNTANIGIVSYITSDGLTLTKEDGFRITPTAAGLSSLSHLTIVTMADGTYRGYFSNMAHGTTADLVVKSATSTDLLTWTMDSGVRMGTGAATLSTYSAEQPHALQRGSGCVTLFYYSSYDLSASGILIPPQLRYSTSTDGTTFSVDYPLYSGSNILQGNGPDIIRLKDGTYLLYYDAAGGTGNTGAVHVGKLALK